MGGFLSTPAFYHPDLLAVLQCHRAKPWHITPLLKTHAPSPLYMRARDPDWSRNSPVAIELVDILNGALKDMGGWPICETIRCWCCSPSGPVQSTPPQMVEAFEKVCQQVNEAKLFSMGLQCRAGMYKIERYAGSNKVVLDVFCVLVEKRDDEKLRNVEALDTLEYSSSLKFLAMGPCPPKDQRDHHAAVTTWSPPANWMARVQ